MDNKPSVGMFLYISDLLVGPEISKMHVYFRMITVSPNNKNVRIRTIDIVARLVVQARSFPLGVDLPFFHCSKASLSASFLCFRQLFWSVPSKSLLEIHYIRELFSPPVSASKSVSTL